MLDQPLFATPSQFGQNGMADFSASIQTSAQFFKNPVLNQFLSNEEGRPVYEDRDFVRIRQRGERDCLEREVTLADKQRFAPLWAAYEAGARQEDIGTPLSLVFPGQPSIVKELEHQHVYTAEQLLGLSDAQTHQLGMGVRQRQDRARQYLAAAAKGAIDHRTENEVITIKAENQRLVAENAALQRQVADLEAELDDATEPSKPTPRRTKAA